MDANRVILTFEQAADMLAEGEHVHTFVQSGAVLIGADWGRPKLLALMRESACELAGDTATSMGHGLVVWDGKRPLFVATKEASTP